MMKEQLFRSCPSRWHRAWKPLVDVSVASPQRDTLAAAYARELIEQTVRRRATHETRDQVGDTRSSANMERTLKREYWGRSLRRHEMRPPSPPDRGATTARGTMSPIAP